MSKTIAVLEGSPFEPIKYDEELTEFDLSQTYPCDDRLTAKLILDDYDWMHYTLTSVLPTKKQGFLIIKAEYVGTTISFMKVTWRKNSKSSEKKTYRYEFPCEYIVEFLKKYMRQHIEQWDSEFAFCGEELVIELFNNVIENFTRCKLLDDNENNDDNKDW